MKRVNLSRGKKISLALLGLFMAAMVLATIVAENIYYDSLPAVTTGTVQRDRMRVSYNVNGYVGFEKEASRYLAPAAFEIVDFLVENGASVSLGEPLYQVSTDEVLLARDQLRLEVLQLEKANKTLGNDEAGKLQKEINALKMDKFNDQIAQLERLYENDGIMSAQRAGVFEASIQDHSAVFDKQEIGSVISNTSQAFVSWQMSAEERKLFHLGDEISTNIIVTEIIGEKEVESSISYKTRIAEITQQGQDYTFKARIGDDVTLGMDEGASVTVNCSYLSVESYAYVVPLSAFYPDEYGTSGVVYLVKTRERIYGEEYYVTPYQVEVEYQVGNSVALRNFGEDAMVVTFSTKPLTAEGAVKLYGY